MWIFARATALKSVPCRNLIVSPCPQKTLATNGCINNWSNIGNAEKRTQNQGKGLGKMALQLCSRTCGLHRAPKSKCKCQRHRRSSTQRDITAKQNRGWASTSRCFLFTQMQHVPHDGEQIPFNTGNFTFGITVTPVKEKRCSS